jgi:hypothetical protein
VALNLQHQTGAEFAARFWARVQQTYAQGDKLGYARCIWWIWTRIQAGDLTSDQVRVSYNANYGKSLNNAQWNNLVTNTLVPIKDRYLAIINQVEV